MSKIIKTLEYTPEEAKAIALFYNWPEKVMDESLLVDGSVPQTAAVNEDGTPRYEMDVVWAANGVDIESETPKLDDDSNPIQAMEDIDVFINNPVTAETFISGLVDSRISDLLTAPVEAAVKQQAEQAAAEAEAAVNATVEANKEQVAAKITTVIE